MWTHCSTDWWTQRLRTQVRLRYSMFSLPQISPVRSPGLKGPQQSEALHTEARLTRTTIKPDRHTVLKLYIQWYKGSWYISLQSCFLSPFKVHTDWGNWNQVFQISQLPLGFSVLNKLTVETQQHNYLNCRNHPIEKHAGKFHIQLQLLLPS